METTVNQRIKVLLDSHDMNPNSVAKLLNVAPQTIYNKFLEKCTNLLSMFCLVCYPYFLKQMQIG
jgi:hypothetical protein